MSSSLSINNTQSNSEASRGTTTRLAHLFFRIFPPLPEDPRERAQMLENFFGPVPLQIPVRPFAEQLGMGIEAVQRGPDLRNPHFSPVFINGSFKLVTRDPMHPRSSFRLTCLTGSNRDQFTQQTWRFRLCHQDDQLGLHRGWTVGPWINWAELENGVNLAQGRMAILTEARLHSPRVPLAPRRQEVWPATTIPDCPCPLPVSYFNFRMRKLLTSGRGSHITLVLKSRAIHIRHTCNEMALLISSPFWNVIRRYQPQGGERITLSGLYHDPSVIRVMVYVMHHGKLPDLEAEFDWARLLDVAELFQMSQLKSLVISKLSQCVSVHSAQDIANLAELYRESALHQKALNLLFNGSRKPIIWCLPQQSLEQPAEIRLRNPNHWLHEIMSRDENQAFIDLQRQLYPERRYRLVEGEDHDVRIVIEVFSDDPQNVFQQRNVWGFYI